MAAPALSVVVPAYDEAACIATTLRSLHNTLGGLGIAHEIILVDNASRDGTADVVEALGERTVRVLRNPENIGKGGSLRRGMLAATGALRLHCEADCGPSVHALGRMIELAERYDVVVGSRLASGATVGRRQPVRRRIAGRSFGLLCRVLLREPTRDLFCGFKLWRAPAAEAAFRASALTGWTFDAETLAVARALGSASRRPASPGLTARGRGTRAGRARRARAEGVARRWRGDGRGRLPSRGPAAVPRLGAPGRRAWADRQPP